MTDDDHNTAVLLLLWAMPASLVLLVAVVGGLTWLAVRLGS